MLKGTAVPSCGGGRVTAVPSECPNTQCCGKQAAAHNRREPKEKKNLAVGPKFSFFIATEGSSDVLLVWLGLVWLSFSQGSLCSQPSWETCRKSVQHCLCWAWRTAKGGKGIFIFGKNDPEVSVPQPSFFQQAEGVVFYFELYQC